MSKKVTHADLKDALEEFAESLGLELKQDGYYGNVLEGEIDEGLLPTDNELTTEVTKEVKEVKTLDYGSRQRFFYPPYKITKEATLLGKVNALAEFLGVDFEVSPEKVTAEKVKVVKKKGKK